MSMAMDLTLLKRAEKIAMMAMKRFIPVHLKFVMEMIKTVMEKKTKRKIWIRIKHQCGDPTKMVTVLQNVEIPSLVVRHPKILLSTSQAVNPFEFNIWIVMKKAWLNNTLIYTYKTHA